MKEEMLQKMMSVLEKMWVSTDTISKIKDETKAPSEEKKPEWTAIMVAVKKTEWWKELCDYSPEEIDNMPEKELKSLVKDYISKEKTEDNPIANRVMWAKTMY